jgi:hypothetical protein
MVGVIIVALVVLIAYSTWPGSNPRQALTLPQRMHNVISDPDWYVLFPVFGLGLHSGALGFEWAFPFSAIILIGAAIVGAVFVPWVLTEDRAPPLRRKAVVSGVLSVGALVVLVNVPLIVTQVGYSARTFTPTWLVLSGAAAVGGSHVTWRRKRILGALAGTFAAMALLSLALSASVRVRTDEFDRAAARWIADRTENGDIVAVCDVGRTVVDPAPLGAFHLHALHSTSGAWIEYYTGRVVEVRRSGLRYWGSRCPDLRGANLVIRFPALVREVGESEDAPG